MKLNSVLFLIIALCTNVNSRKLCGSNSDCNYALSLTSDWVRCGCVLYDGWGNCIKRTCQCGPGACPCPPDLTCNTGDDIIDCVCTRKCVLSKYYNQANNTCLTYPISSCSAGTYDTKPWNAPNQCLVCPTGSFCVGTATCNSCPSCNGCNSLGVGLQTCTVCQSNKYRVSVCTSTQDTVCNNCKACAAGEFISTPCGTTSDTVCSSCTLPCASNQYETSPCSGTSNRVCAACPSNSYCNGVSSATCSTCDAGTY